MLIFRITLSICVALVTAILLVNAPKLQFWSTTPPTTCEKQASVDTPMISSTNISGNIAGWAFNAKSPVSAIIVRAKGKEISRNTQFVPRSDVALVRSDCQGLDNAGFSFPVVVGKIPAGTQQLDLFAVSKDGSEFSVGRVAVDFSLPLAVIESPQPITRNSVNLITGWATHPDGTVKVRLLAGQQVLWEGSATRPRDDVGSTLPAWPSAGHASFEISLSVAELPLVDSPTIFEFTAPSGATLNLPGPPLQNQGAIGKVLVDEGNAFVLPGLIHLRAWAWHTRQIVSAKLETEQGKVIALLKQSNAKALLSEFKDPRFTPAVTRKGFNPSGQIFSVAVQGRSIPSGLQRLVVRVRDGGGKDTIFPGPLVWNPTQPMRDLPCAGSRYLVFLPGINTHGKTSALFEELQRFTNGVCITLGIQTRIEYLRTTRGLKHDFIFDPDFPESIRRPTAEREMTSSSLNSALAMAAKYRVPLNLVLDGGVWADSKFSIPDYDVVDWLEQDESTVQWNQWGKSEPDAAIKSLAGSQNDPELSRMMSLNRYNTRFMDYKKRNFQTAVRLIVAHNQRYKDAPVSINLDPDEYINPWFINRQWYDYNPGSLRQFREWLLHTGPYADGGELASARPTQRFDLTKLRKVSGKNWQKSDEIDPPREKPDYASEWQQLWVRFKRHLVAQHYADLSRWAAEMGLPASQVRTSQTFLDSRVATQINETAETWSDEAGVSIEGAKPAHGHLGAIFYGPGSRNEGKPRNGESLLDNVRRIDPQWGIVEMHPGNISTPHVLISQLDAYRTMLTMINFGASRITPMWGSSAGDQMVHPGHFRSYDVYDQSPFETQFVWWMQTLRNQPWGGQVWPFGNNWVESTDGWVAQGKARLTASAPGFVTFSNESQSGKITMQSPSLRLSGNTLKLQVKGSWPADSLTAQALLDDEQRVNIPLGTDATGRLTPPPGRTIRRVDLTWQSPGSTKILIDEVRLTPVPDAAR